MSLVTEVFSLTREVASLFDALLGVGTDEENWGMLPTELEIFAIGVTMFTACVWGGDEADVELKVTSTEGDVKAASLEKFARETPVDVSLEEPGSGPPKLGGTMTC